MENFLVLQSFILSVLCVFGGFWTAFHMSYSLHTNDGTLSPINLLVAGTVPTSIITLAISTTPAQGVLSSSNGPIFGVILIVGMLIHVPLHRIVVSVFKRKQQDKYAFFVKVFAYLTGFSPLVVVVCEGILLLGFLDPALKLEAKAALTALYLFTVGLLLWWYAFEF